MFPSSLFARLSLFFLLILLALGLTTLWVSHRNSRSYFLEFTQQLNSPIAMYMADNADLIVNRQPDTDALSELVKHVVVINPSVEVYLLDMAGNVIEPIITGDHDTGAENYLHPLVDLAPIHKFLDPESVYPIFGTNPRSADYKNIFSVAPLFTPPSIGQPLEQLGFVYVVLAGERHQPLLNSLSNSYSIKNLSLTLAGVLLFALLAGISVFFLLTRRLRLLTQKATQWQQTLLSQLGSGGTDNVEMPFVTRLPGPGINERARDEIDVLAATYDSMAAQLVTQYQHLQLSDKNRREFFANISHDLRTPLTTMQSYLETLVLRSDTMEAADRKRYLETAHKQTLRLRRMVMQLFELSKLSSGSVVLEPERFSLLELTFDCVQQFALEAKQAGVTLSVKPHNDDTQQFDVYADIALIQRVYENLLANSLRFTSSGGVIEVELTRSCHDHVDIVVRDTGSGISEDQIAHVFTRHYPETSVGEGRSGNAGLGLSIVENILDLHNSDIRMRNVENKGTEVSFTLPTEEMTAQ